MTHYCSLSLSEFGENMKKPILSILTLLLMLMAGCGGESTESNKDHLEIDTNAIKEGVGEEMYDRARSMFYSMPSPLELQSLIVEAGGYFREDLLHDPQQSSQYQSTEQQAFALGVYGTDMSYSTVFSQQQDALLYLAAAQRVAKKMGVHDPFSGGLIERANNNIDDKDSMLLIVSEIYWEINSQLQEEERNSLGLIVLAAGWVEGVYLGSHIMNKEKPEPKIAQVLVDQRFIAAQMDQLFKDFAHESFIAASEPYFRPLIDKYLSLPVVEEAASVQEVNGKTVIGGATKVSYTAQDLADITRISEEARAKIIQL
jgi:hypothetical protein